MASASPKEKFDAAIKVIHSLPKDGPFQPSKDMMLTFYGYYKQATEGPCTASKPSFWDIVKKAKWEAWNKLGDMERETAMDNYVDELKKTMKICSKQWNEMSKNGDPRIVEAMPQTAVVGDFMEKLGTFYEIVDEESPIEEARRSNPASVPLDDGYNTESSPDTSNNNYDTGEDQLIVSGKGNHVESDHTYSSSTQGPDGNHIQSSDSEEEFCDTSMDLEIPLTKLQGEFLLQNGSIPNLEATSPAKPAKNNHVRFAGLNGRLSPTENGGNHIDRKETLRVSQGFPFISSGSTRSQDDSMIVETGSPLEARLGNLDNDLDVSAENNLDLSAEIAVSGLYGSRLKACTGSGNYIEGGEENEPPDGGEGGDKGKDKGQGKSSHSQRSTPRRTGSQGTVPGSSSGGRRQLLAGGGAGGGDEGGDNYSPSGDAVNQQIAQVLVRLQQDMTSVLDRLNRLETQSRQTQRQQNPERNPPFSWWPFATRTGRAAFFFLVWPIIVHLVLSYLFRRRRRR